MDNQEARFILSACRPNGSDHDDPRIRAALERLSTDPALAEWFQKEQAFDAAMASLLAQTSPPAELRQNILAGAKISAPRRWQAPVWAMAATVVLSLTLAILWLRDSRSPGLAHWQTQALHFLEGSVVLDHQSGDVNELKGWLRQRSAPAPEVLPAALAGLPGVGCKVLRDDGRVISIICFTMDSGELAHLVLTRSGGSRDEAPRFSSSDGWNLVTWSEGGTSMMLATRAPAEELRHLL